VFPYNETAQPVTSCVTRLRCRGFVRGRKIRKPLPGGQHLWVGEGRNSEGVLILEKLARPLRSGLEPITGSGLKSEYADVPKKRWPTSSRVGGGSAVLGRRQQVGGTKNRVRTGRGSSFTEGCPPPICNGFPARGGERVINEGSRGR